jgi:hypothetical protein
MSKQEKLSAIQAAINNINNAVKSAKLTYQDHVVMDKCINVLATAVQSKYVTPQADQTTELPEANEQLEQMPAPTETAAPARKRTQKKGDK